MKNEITAINSSILKWAREYYGLSFTEVSNKTNIPAQQIESWEKGEDYPTYSKLKKLCEFYKKPMITFFLDAVPTDMISTYDIACRSNSEICFSSDNKRIRELFELANIYRINLSELFENEDRPNFYELLSRNNISSNNEPLSIRNILKFSLDEQKAIKSVPQLLEIIRERLYDIGIYVFKEAFRTDEFSGLCLYDKDYPIILLNNSTSFTRQLFTVFHELYHLINKRADLEKTSTETERECDKFASEFLIPSDDFNKITRKTNNYEDVYLIESLANTYKVSRDAICYRLCEQGKISHSFYDKLRREFNEDFRQKSKSSGGNYYATKASYLGKTYLSSIITSYYSGKITVQQVGKFANIKTSQVATLASTLLGGVL